MAGGTYTAQNKVRPGAYINFQSVPAPTSNVGTRGIMTMPVEMSWGPEDAVINLYSTDLLNGNSLAKIGFTAFDAGSLIYRMALSESYLAKLYRIDTGGAKATAEVGGLTVTALYAGTTGNKIAVAVAANAADETKFDVVTYFDGVEKDRQTVTAAWELIANDWVTFGSNVSAGEDETPEDETVEDETQEDESSGDATPEDETPVVISVTGAAGVFLDGGADGAGSPANYAAYLKAIDQELWNTMAVPSADNSVNEQIVQYVKNKRENTGRKVQAVLVDYSTADYEGIISVSQGYVNTASERVEVPAFAARIAGMTAGATLAGVNSSLTFRTLNDAVTIINPIADEDAEAALKSGKMILIRRQDGSVVVEQDVNTLHTFTPYHDYQFSKNRVIRVLDDIGNQVLTRFENAYIGKVDNNAQGRAVFKADIISYMNELQGMGAIQNFDPATDITVSQGTEISAVVCELWVQPVDAMEKLYMLVNVGGEA